MQNANKDYQQEKQFLTQNHEKEKENTEKEFQLKVQHTEKTLSLVKTELKRVQQSLFEAQQEACKQMHQNTANRQTLLQKDSDIQIMTQKADQQVQLIKELKQKIEKQQQQLKELEKKTIKIEEMTPKPNFKSFIETIQKLDEKDQLNLNIDEKQNTQQIVDSMTSQINQKIQQFDQMKRSSSMNNSCSPTKKFKRAVQKRTLSNIFIKSLQESVNSKKAAGTNLKPNNARSQSILLQNDNNLGRSAAAKLQHVVQNQNKAVQPLNKKNQEIIEEDSELSIQKTDSSSLDQTATKKFIANNINSDMDSSKDNKKSSSNNMNKSRQDMKESKFKSQKYNKSFSQL